MRQRSRIVRACAAAVSNIEVAAALGVSRPTVGKWRARFVERQLQGLVDEQRRHRSVEFREFLNKIDAEVPAELDVHLICDNYATHKTDIIQRRLATPASTCTSSPPAHGST